MVEFGFNTNWRIGINVNNKIELYTGTIIEESDTHLKLSTIKNEMRVISKNDVINAVLLKGKFKGV